MSKIEIPEGTLKQWCEDLKKLCNSYFESNRGFVLIPENTDARSLIIMLEHFYIKAKTSSYELKETLRKRGNNLSRECVLLQQRIAELEKDLESERVILFHTLEIEKVHISEIEKRDELLGQAFPWVSSYQAYREGMDLHSSDNTFKKMTEWMKKANALKGEK